MSEEQKELTPEESDERFDQAVREAFADEGLMVTHFVIIVEVVTEEGNTRLVHHESENLSEHLRMGMLHSALDPEEEKDEEDE